MSTAAPSAPILQGRPRDPGKDAAVIRATRELLVEVGYHDLSVVAIARRAGVTTPTIYRRWPSKESLVEDVAFGHSQPAPLPAPTGDLAADLRAWVELMLDYLADPVMRAALPGLLALYQGDDDKYQQMMWHFERDVRDQMVDVITRAQPTVSTSERDLRADAVFDMLVASTTVQALMRGLADRDGFCARTTHRLVVLARSPHT